MSFIVKQKCIHFHGKSQISLVTITVSTNSIQLLEIMEQRQSVPPGWSHFGLIPLKKNHETFIWPNHIFLSYEILLKMLIVNCLRYEYSHTKSKLPLVLFATFQPTTSLPQAKITVLRFNTFLYAAPISLRFCGCARVQCLYQCAIIIDKQCYLFHFLFWIFGKTVLLSGLVL